jgi:uncharacterized protein YehS (DUF1456 family)
MLFVLLLTYLLSVLGDNSFVYTKHKIRRMLEKEKHNPIHYLFDKELEHIYNGVLQQAKIGKDESKFSMLCPNEKLNLHITLSMSITFLEDCQ